VAKTGCQHHVPDKRPSSRGLQRMSSSDEMCEATIPSTRCQAVGRARRTGNRQRIWQKERTASSRRRAIG